MKYIWPEVFVNGYVPLESNKAALLVDALSAWAGCMCGNPPPEHFGQVMAIIGRRLGVLAVPDELMALSKRVGF